MLCALALMASPATAARVEIADDRMLVVNGERTFVLGLYENPGDDAVLRQAAEAGFNLFAAGPSREALDRLQAAGAYGWINLGDNVNLSESAEARRAALTRLAAEYGSHPALLVWEVPDEALWSCWYGPFVWRRYQEPEAQLQHLNALTDARLAEELKARQRQVLERTWAGDYRGAEQLADSIWGDLGVESPHPHWNVSDAAASAARVQAGLLAGYQFLKSLGIQQPVWMNHAPRNQVPQLAAFSEAADIVGCDIYPVPEYLGGHSDLADRSLSAVGAYTLRMQAAAPGKPVWMVLQGFSWGEINPSMEEWKRREMVRPEFEETRFMAYDAIVRGARGLAYWGTSTVEKDSELWQDLLRLAGELKSIRQMLTAPDAPLRPAITHEETWGSVDRGVVVLGKEVGGRTWLLVVNEWVEPLTYTMHGLGTLEGTMYVDRLSGRAATVANGSLTTTIAGQAVQVLEPVSGGPRASD